MSEAKKRILVVTLRYPPYVAGGYELLTRDAALALRARGHHVDVLAGKGERFADAPAATDGVRVLPWLVPDLDDDSDFFMRSIEGSNLQRFRMHFLEPANYRATLRAIDLTQPDVVFFFNLGLVSIAPILAARHAGVATLGYISDPWPANHWLLDWEQRGSKPDRLRALRAFWNSFRDLVGLGELLTCSNYIKERLSGYGVPAHSMEVVHLGVPPDMAALAEQATPVARRADEPLRIACLSSFWDGKGQDVLLGAASIARASGTDVEVVLAGTGTGEYRTRLEEMASSAPLAGAVSFVEALDRVGVSALLARSHVLVLPSVWGEPFALSTLEGMAHGLAVVASDAGGSPEALASGVEGVIFPSGDVEALAETLVRLAADEAMRVRLGRDARRRAFGELSHTTFVDRLELALDRVAR